VSRLRSAARNLIVMNRSKNLGRGPAKARISLNPPLFCSALLSEAGLFGGSFQRNRARTELKRIMPVGGLPRTTGTRNLADDYLSFNRTSASSPAATSTIVEGSGTGDAVVGVNVKSPLAQSPVIPPDDGKFTLAKLALIEPLAPVA
jgi:hypothetical protein